MIASLLTEDAQGFLNPMDVRSSYPMAKRAAETLCHNYAKEYGTHIKVARLAQTFGAGVTKKRQSCICTIRTQHY